MNAIVHSSCFEPKPLQHGFIVDSTLFKLFKPSNYVTHQVSYPTVPAINMSRYFKPFKPVLRTIPNSLSKPNLKNTTSVAPVSCFGAGNRNIIRMQAEDEDLDLDKTLDILISTDDTLGPETPPITHNISVRSTFHCL